MRSNHLSYLAIKIRTCDLHDINRGDLILCAIALFFKDCKDIIFAVNMKKDS
jgi:hypothetical protein